MKYWAVRFTNDSRLRVTNRRFSTKEEACLDTFGMSSDCMRAVQFGKKWRNMTIREKTAVEEQLASLCLAGS